MWARRGAPLPGLWGLGAMQNPDVFWITYEAGRPLWHKSFKLGDATV